MLPWEKLKKKFWLKGSKYQETLVNRKPMWLLVWHTYLTQKAKISYIFYSYNI